MHKIRLVTHVTAFAIAAAAANFTTAATADFPSRPVRVVVPSTPGGALDILSRMLAQKLPARWNGQSLVVELFKRMAGVEMIHVPFKGAGAANAAVVTGQVQILNTALGAAMTFIKSGKLKGLAVTGLKRAASAPDIPTVIESGLPGYVVDGWFAALAPAKTPQAIVDKLQADFAWVYAMPDMAARLAAQGFEADNPKPRETAKFIDAEIAK